MNGSLPLALPDFPWDVLAPYAERARAHPGGAIDLSVGTPVDPTPAIVQQALRDASDAPGYPTTAGRPELRAACARWMARSTGASVDVDAVLPTIGSKEMVAGLPRLLGLGTASSVVIPRIAYPTYAVGAVLAGAEYVATDEPESVPGADLVWLNSPGNPTGRVLSASRLASIVDWARSTGTVLVSDECYIELGWDEEPVSMLHPTVSGGSHDGLLVLHSLSKRSNLAGYRFGFLAGDPALVSRILLVRKHSGMMVPSPIQAAAIAALDDDEHVREQKDRYRRRRSLLMEAVTSAGFRIDDSQAGLYLWITRDEPCWDTVGWFADRGVVVTPGDFYGPAGARHVRLALTATDHAMEQVPIRLA